MFLPATAAAAGDPEIPAEGWEYSEQWDFVQDEYTAEAHEETAEQLEGYLAALDLKLSDEHLARLDAVSAVPLGSPHEIVRASRGVLLGGDPARFRPTTPTVA